MNLVGAGVVGGEHHLPPGWRSRNGAPADYASASEASIRSCARVHHGNTPSSLKG